MGIKHLGGEADAGKQVTLSSGELMHHDPDVGAVIVGRDVAFIQSALDWQAGTELYTSFLVGGER